MANFYNDLQFNTNQALDMRFHIIDDGDYAGTPQEGMVLYFRELTGSPASTDFLEGEGIYIYTNSVWKRIARYDEITTPSSAINIRGSVSPSAANFPYPKDSAAMMTGAIQTGNGSGLGPQIQAGDAWYITPGSLALPTVIGPAPGETVDANYTIIAKVDNASNAHADWLILTSGGSPASVSSATETVEGILEIATQVETDAGTDDSRAVTPLKLKNNYAANNVITMHEQVISGTAGTAIFTDIDAVNRIGNIVVLNTDRVPDSNIVFGTPFINASQLNIPWTASSSISNYFLIIMAKMA